MRRLHELEVADFNQHLVWRYVSSNGDELARVEPVDLVALTAEASPEVFIARTAFRLAHGRVHIGYCSPQDWSGVDYVQPVIVVGRRYVRFWHEHAEKPFDPERVAFELAQPVAAIFPVVCRVSVPVDGAVRRGVLREDGSLSSDAGS